MMWPYYGGGWIWMGFAMLLVWAAVIAFVFIGVRVFAHPGAAGTDPALQTLRQRPASGQIDSEEFEKARRVLER